MSSRPLYRSITFWSGILVMCFIGRAWADSQKVITVASIGSPTAIHGHNGILIRKIHETDTGAWRLPSFYQDRVIPDIFPLPFSFVTEFEALDRKFEIHITLPDHRRDGRFRSGSSRNTGHRKASNGIGRFSSSTVYFC